MADRLSPDKRSWLMSHVKSKDTTIELKVRKWLFSQGFRYRKNVATLPGKPDIVLKKYNTIIFIHGCFWHRHPNCPKASIPKSKTEYWVNKFEKNIERDHQNIQKLEKYGWKVIVIWQCQIQKNFDQCMNSLSDTLRTST